VTDGEISLALRTHLAALQNRPQTFWENEGGEPEGNHWLVYQLKAPPERRGVSAIHKHNGELVVAVLVPEKTFQSEAERQADTIVAHFPADLEITHANGRVHIIEKAYARAGYPDGAYWRVNVHVRWTAYSC
jgi:hypothetical protein